MSGSHRLARSIFSLMQRLFLLLLAVAAVAGWWWWQGREPQEPLFSGTVEADEVHIASRYGGRVEALPVAEGAEVAAGEVIAELAAPELRARRELLAARLAELENGPRPEEVEAARRDWEALVAQRAYAISERKRNHELAAQKAVASADAERTASLAEALEQSAAAAEARYQLLREGTRPEVLAQARAALAEVDSQLAEMRITAPAAAVLEVLAVKPGDVLPPNREVATLLLPALWIRVYVPTEWLSRIALGHEAELRVDGLAGATFRGVIEQINREAEFTPRNVQTEGDRLRQVFGVKVRLAPGQGRLRAGMSGTIRFAEGGQ